VSAGLILPTRDPPGLLELGRLVLAEDIGSPDVAELAEATLSYATPWSTALEADLQELAVDRGARLAAARSFLERDRAHPWIAPLHEQRQLWVGLEGAELRRSDATEPLWRPPQGYWNPGRGFWTQSERAGAGPTALRWSPGWRRHVWAYGVPETARIYELASAAGWSELVARYPRLVASEPFPFPSSDWWLPAPLYLPDFEAFAGDWDALRISVPGALGAANHLLEVLDGWTFMVHEDFVEGTLWLRWVFGAADDLGSVPGRPTRGEQVLPLGGARDTWPAQVEAARRDGWQVVPPAAYPPPYEQLRDDERYVLMRRG
jgi:hypothetical protein